ncbi:YALIA101S07e05050g1_1 [Yarrowia lipolytica]|jgi:hypothetical protein|nr:Hypothetical protein YALI2_D00031g [Yarrowia lipolytica]SEI35596.1 YALIA101S07e05050g1_1 [Yarrowia lipolytica]
MTTPKNKRKFGWMKRLVNGGKEGELSRTDNTNTGGSNTVSTKENVGIASAQPMTFDTPLEDVPQLNQPTQPTHSQSSQQTETQANHVTQTGSNHAQNTDYDNSYGTSYNADNSEMNSGSDSENDSVYSQPSNNNAADFYGQMYDVHNSSQLYPSRMDNSSTEGIKSVRDNHSMRSGSVLTDMANHPAGSTIGSPRSIAKSVGWHSVGSRSPKSIKSTDSLKSGIVGNSWRRRDYYKFLTDEDDDGSSITGDNHEGGPSSSHHVRIDSDRLDSRGSGTHPHSPLAQSHSSSSLMFDAPSSPQVHDEHLPSSSTAPHHHSNLADSMVVAEDYQQSNVSSSALHGLGVSMEGLNVNDDNSNNSNNSISESSSTEGAEQDGPSTAGSSARGIRNGSHHSIDHNDNGNATSSHYNNNGNGHGNSNYNGSYNVNTNPNAAARSTSYSSSLSTSGFASPSIMSQNSDGASTSYTVPSGMHHVQLQPQQHQGHHHGQQNLQVNTVPNLDNASIITLASSSKRRRRRSVDTMASTRGIAPASLYVNRSVESLPMDTDTETNHSVER